jgi:lipoate-protein ligase A
MARPLLHVLRLPQGRMGIFDQLCLEEALLRTDKRNWCIINHGQEQPTIVMGISGQVDALLHKDKVAKERVPVIRRFTGGGTVVTDSGTLYVSFICNKSDMDGQPLYPREVMKWSEGVYAPVFKRLVSGAGASAPSPAFALREHDYVLGDRKCGGNAQSVARDRWVHHTSFLWDFRPERMGLLQMPAKRPEYRADRRHEDFLTPLSAHIRPPSDRHTFVDALVEELGRVMRAEATPLETALEVLARPQERKTNTFVEV